MPKGILYVKNHTFTKSTLVMDGKKELVFAEGAGHKVQRRFLLRAPAYTDTGRLVPGFRSKGVDMAEKVVHASRGGARGGAERGGRWWRWESSSHCGRGIQSALPASAMNSAH